MNLTKFSKPFLAIIFVVMLFGMFLPMTAHAQADGPCASINSKGGNGLGLCIVSIYRWALGLAVLLALGTIIASGYYYMTAGGDASRVQSAKDMFTNAFIGLIILFAAVLILRTINPDLVNFESLSEDQNNGDGTNSEGSNPGTEIDAGTLPAAPAPPPPVESNNDPAPTPEPEPEPTPEPEPEPGAGGTTPPPPPPPPPPG